MAKEVVIWCDPCLADEVRTPSKEYRLGVGPQMKTVDLCDDHADQFVKPLLALLEEFGAAIVATPPAAGRATKRVSVANNRSTGPVPEMTLLAFEQTGTRKGLQPSGERLAQCLWCPLDYSSDGSGFTRHLQSAHGLEHGLRTFGGDVPCPICGREDIALMGAHLQKSHEEFGFKSITKAFLWARDNGDPHGAYARVLAKAPVRA